jgi:hypothetical protein
LNTGEAGIGLSIAVGQREETEPCKPHPTKYGLPQQNLLLDGDQSGDQGAQEEDSFV